MICFLFLFVCRYQKDPKQDSAFKVPGAGIPVFNPHFDPSITSVGKIPLPAGYNRLQVNDQSYAAWLRKILLRRQNIVCMYNKRPIANQFGHYAVLDISTGQRDLQQCADAIMRLKAEYLFSISAYEQINFIASDKTVFNFKEFAKGQRYALRGRSMTTFQSHIDNSCYTHPCLMQFLECVFRYCSTYTLQLQTTTKNDFSSILPGDMLVKGGSPGHAMIVLDVAKNTANSKIIYMLGQGFMPAQNIHIVKNPGNLSLGPWYEVNDTKKIITPGYIFEKSQLRKW